MARVIVADSGKGSYTERWLRWQVERSPIRDANVELVSLCDVDDFGSVLDPPPTGWVRYIGGSESFNERLCGYFADHVVVGEGFEFFNACRSGRPPTEAPYLFTPGQSGIVVPSTNIVWPECPMFQVGPKKVMVLAERGCRNKCRFCYTSWTTRPAQNPRIKLPDGKWVVNLIANENATTDDDGAAVKSAKVRDYVSMSGATAARCKHWRLGVESFTEAGRRRLGKPITNEELREVFRLSKRWKHNLTLFVIGGLEPEDSVLEFLSTVDRTEDMRPVILVKVTYFNPNLHTPMAGYDIRTLHNWNHDKLFGRLKGASVRFRLVMREDPGRSIWRGLAHRARSAEEFRWLWRLRNQTRARIERDVEQAGLSALWTEPLPSLVKLWWQR